MYWWAIETRKSVLGDECLDTPTARDNLAFILKS